MRVLDRPLLLGSTIGFDQALPSNRVSEYSQ